MQTRDGGYVFTGGSWSFGDSAYTVYLIKTDAVGKQLWLKTCGGIRFTVGNSIESTSDGGFIIAGMIDSLGTAQSHQHSYVIKTDSSGDVLWTRIYTASSADRSLDIEQTTDNGFIFITWSIGSSGNSSLIKINTLGDVVWTRMYTDITARSVLQTSDGGYAIGGYTFPFGFGNAEVYLVKTDGNGIVSSVKDDGNNSIPAEYALHQNYPNPFNPSTSISYSIPKQAHVRLQIFNPLGQLIATLVDQDKPPGTYTVIWDAGTRSSGLYFYRIAAGEFVQTRKALFLK